MPPPAEKEKSLDARSEVLSLLRMYGLEIRTDDLIASLKHKGFAEQDIRNAIFSLLKDKRIIGTKDLSLKKDNLMLYQKPL